MDSLLVEGYLWEKKSEDIESGKEKNWNKKDGQRILKLSYAIEQLLENKL